MLGRNGWLFLLSFPFHTPVCYDGGMKNLLLLLTMLCAFSTPLVAQNTPPNITLEAAFLEMAYNGNLAAVQEFVSKGTPVDSTVDDKSTALMWAAFNGHTAVAAYLLERGATVDAKDINGRTALLYASSGPYAETVGLLLRNGADVNVQGKTEGFTALMMAASEGYLEVARVLLVNGAAVDTIDRDGDTAKKFAREKGHTEMLELLESQPVKGSPP
jgi:ankyrin repeat protein